MLSAVISCLTTDPFRYTSSHNEKLIGPLHRFKRCGIIKYWINCSSDNIRAIIIPYCIETLLISGYIWYRCLFSLRHFHQTRLIKSNHAKGQCSLIIFFIVLPLIAFRWFAGFTWFLWFAIWLYGRIITAVIPYIKEVHRYTQVGFSSIVIYRTYQKV